MCTFFSRLSSPYNIRKKEVAFVQDFICSCANQEKNFAYCVNMLLFGGVRLRTGLKLFIASLSICICLPTCITQNLFSTSSLKHRKCLKQKSLYFSIEFLLYSYYITIVNSIIQRSFKLYSYFHLF